MCQSIAFTLQLVIPTAGRKLLLLAWKAIAGAIREQIPPYSRNDKPSGMRRLLLLTLLLSHRVSSDCIPFSDAAKHVGETRCVTGKVYDVQMGVGGHHYLDFCEDYRVCPFTVVIFAGDLRHVGDVRRLKGNVVEIHGPVKEYDGRAEIILREARQLTGGAASIPPLPKNYDVEKKGHYSAGRIQYPKAARKTSKKQKGPVQTEEIDLPE